MFSTDRFGQLKIFGGGSYYNKISVFIEVQKDKNGEPVKVHRKKKGCVEFVMLNELAEVGYGRRERKVLEIYNFIIMPYKDLRYLCCIKCPKNKYYIIITT